MLLIHLVGLVGAGKTHFLHSFFPTSPAFDIKDVYEEYCITPQDLRRPEIYSQFASAVEFTLTNFTRQFAGEPVGFIESSGINQAINRSLARYPHKTLWIQSHFSDKIALERPYAPRLNARILDAYHLRRIQNEWIFDGDTQLFYAGGNEIKDWKFLITM